MQRMFYAALLTVLLLSGCVVAPAHHGGPDVIVAPALPVVVELGVEPYYFHSGFYYYYHDHAWSYSRERAGPWRDLPRDRYPREIRYKDREHDRDRDRDRDRDEHRDR
jgi:hypothetical protein